MMIPNPLVSQPHKWTIPVTVLTALLCKGRRYLLLARYFTRGRTLHPIPCELLIIHNNLSSPLRSASFLLKSK
ncbi:hypothetical protein AB205_0003090, partial [Aquarana catesbeiana]